MSSAEAGKGELHSLGMEGAGEWLPFYGGFCEAGRALGTGLTRLMRSLGSHGGWLRLLVVSAMVLLLPLGDGGGKGCVAWVWATPAAPRAWGRRRDKGRLKSLLFLL